MRNLESPSQGDIMLTRAAAGCQYFHRTPPSTCRQHRRRDRGPSDDNAFHFGGDALEGVLRKSWRKRTKHANDKGKTEMETGGLPH